MIIILREGDYTSLILQFTQLGTKTSFPLCTHTSSFFLVHLVHLLGSITLLRGKHNRHILSVAKGIKCNVNMLGTSKTMGNRRSALGLNWSRGDALTMVGSCKLLVIRVLQT